MRKLSDLQFTHSMTVAKVALECLGFVLVGWDEFDFENGLSSLRGRYFASVSDYHGWCGNIFCYEGAHGLLFMPFDTLYYRGGKKKSCLIFRRVDK